jgi:aminoglycoside phosphotransferase (APT) family kinase protein
MGFVDGVVQHTLEQTLTLTPDQRRISGESLFDVLADLHAIDIEAVGLSGHGPHSGFVERTIRRWYKQYRASVTRDVPDVDAAYERLLARLPEERELTIAHGDYRLGNCITSFEGPIAAVLDWEISTLGDPLADVAYTLNSWIRPGTEAAARTDGSQTPTMAEGFGSADEMLQRYASRSGRDVSNIDYYVAFNHFKSACIVQGVLSRYLSGALGDTSEVDLEGFARSVVDRSAMAMEALDGLAP